MYAFPIYMYIYIYIYINIYIYKQYRAQAAYSLIFAVNMSYAVAWYIPQGTFRLLSFIHFFGIRLGIVETCPAALSLDKRKRAVCC